MKKTVSFILVLSVIISSMLLFGCSAGKKIDASEDLQRIKDAGVLKIGMECNYIPYNWTQFDDSNGAVKIANTAGYANGFDVQIAKKIADALGVTLEVYAYKWESLVPAVESGALDCIVAGMSPTAERKETVDFSENYYVANLCIVIRKDSKYAEAKSIADLDGMIIACQDGSTHYKYFSQIKNSDARYMTDYATLFTALQAGTIDGFSVEGDTAIAYAEKSDDITYLDLVNNDTGFSISEDDSAVAVGMRKGSDLMNEINKVITSISDSERLEMMGWANTHSPSDDAE